MGIPHASSSSARLSAPLFHIVQVTCDTKARPSDYHLPGAHRNPAGPGWRGEGAAWGFQPDPAPTVSHMEGEGEAQGRQEQSWALSRLRNPGARDSIGPRLGQGREEAMLCTLPRQILPRLNREPSVWTAHD